MKYGICGVAFSGNKGAEGMLIALMQNIRKQDPEAFFHVMSYYPRHDRAAGHEGGDCRIINGSPKRVLLYFFQAIFYFVCRKCHLPCAWQRKGDFGAIADCDLFLDAAGISFCDGREKFTIFNLLTLLPALAAGVRIVKVSQAMGPFKNFLNRSMAKWLLPRLALIVSRGAQTTAFLEELQLKNTVSFSDIAFSLECSSSDGEKAAALLPGKEGKKIIGISPSQVVWKLCRKENIDYLGILAQVTEHCRQKGYHCVVFPHSARRGVKKTHNNDLPLLKKFTAMLSPGEDLTIVEDELEAGVLRQLISCMDVLAASRFHAIVSAMSVGVPAVVIGWSHKYAEVLAPFELDSFVQPYRDFQCEATIAMIETLLKQRQEISGKLLGESTRIKEENRKFFLMISEITGS